MPFPDFTEDEVTDVTPDAAAASSLAQLGGNDVPGKFIFMAPSVPASTTTTGKVGTSRDEAGSDMGDYGCDVERHTVAVQDARGKGMTLHNNGFELVQSELDAPVDFLNEQDIIQRYYPHCCKAVQAATGATKVFAFDHNVRSRALKSKQQLIEGGNAVQGPATIVHGDYTVTSAPRRVGQLTQPPKTNDTMQSVLKGKPLLDVEDAAYVTGGGRWALINLWRNIDDQPVQRTPLGVCDASTVSLDKVVTFEIKYIDRVGENYLCKHDAGNGWYYFPKMTRSEGLLLKCWDTHGAFFAKEGTTPVPATFSYHSAFEVEAPDTAPPRRSIEVRTMAFLPDP